MPSFQDNLKLLHQSKIVGRDEQTDSFRASLALPPFHRKRKHVFNVYGQGGVGKTTLLKLFRDIADQEKTAIGWTDEEQRDPTEVLAKLVEDLEKSGGETFGKLKKRLETFRAQQNKEDPLALEESAGSFLLETAARAGMELLPPGSGVLVDRERASRGIGKVGAELVRQWKRPALSGWSTEPLAELIRLFVEGLNELGDPRIVLFFDTFERTSQHVEEWLSSLIQEAHYGGLPANLTLVIAGRLPMDENRWSKVHQTTERIEINPFSDDDAREYLKRAGITEAPTVDIILKLSGGLPILLETLCATASRAADDVFDPSEKAVGRFLRWVDEPKRRKLAVEAACALYIDRDIVEALVESKGPEDDSEIDELFDWLIAMPFVKQKEEGWSYHEIVRELMLRQNRQKSWNAWDEIHRRLQVFEVSRASAFEENGDDQGRALAEYRALYHRLCRAPDSTLGEAVRKFVDGGPLRHVGADIVRRAGEDAAKPNVLRWGSAFVKLSTPSSDLEEKLAEELAAWSQIEAEFGRDLKDSLAALLSEIAYLSYRLDRWERAALALNRLIDKFSEHEDARVLVQVAQAMNNKGFLLKQTGAAIEVYDALVLRFGDREELPFQEQVALALLNKGLTLGELDRFEEAIEVYDGLILRFGDRDELSLQERVAQALFNKGVRLGELDRFEQEIEVYDALVLRFGDREEPPLQVKVAQALGNKGVGLGELGCSEQAMDVFDALTFRFGDREEQPLQERVAQALLNKGVMLAGMDRSEQAIEVFDALTLRFGDREEPPLQVKVARALAYKGVTLGELGRFEQAIEVYDAVIERYGEHEDARVLKWVAGAMGNKGVVQLKSKDLAGTEVTLRQLARVTGQPVEEFYNYACLCALRGDRAVALGSLARCLDQQSVGVDHVRSDEDWEEFRQDPDFLKLLAKHTPPEESP